MEEEASERDLLPGTIPETVSSVGGGNSTGKSASGASSSKSKGGRAVPHYLRPSAGSCHDFCKYGRKHSFNLGGKRHGFPSLAAGIHSAPEKEQHRVKIPSLAEKRKKSAAKQKASAHPKTGVCDKHVILEEESPRPVDSIKSAEETEIIDQFLEKNILLMGPEVAGCDLPSPSKKVEPYGEFESREQGTRSERSVLDDDPGGEMNREDIPLPVKTVEASGCSETANVNDLQEKPHPSLESASTDRRIRSSKDPFASIKSKFKQRVPSPLKKEFALLAGRSKEGNQEVATSSAKGSTASVKLASPGKLKGTTERSLPPQDRTAGATSKKSESRSPTNVKVLTHVDKKMQKPSPISRSSQPAFNRVSSISLRKVKITGSSSLRRPKNTEEAEGINEKVKERTLHIVEPRSTVERTPGARRTSAVLNQEKKNRVPAPAPAPKHGIRVTKPAQIENKKSGRKGVSSQPDAMDPASSKLKFRRGKVVDPQPVNDAPRRILFRQGRKTGDNQGSKSGRRSFKSRVSAHGAANQRCPEAEAVVLRHQDVPEKEAQGLFNEVIEETANKLVGTRKSKVKALVGAFETVISLQENKPATPI